MSDLRRMWIFLIPMLVVLGGALVAPVSSLAGDYFIAPVTKNDFADHQPRVNDRGDILWTSSPNKNDPFNSEIFLRTAGSYIQVTKNTWPDVSPSLNNNGQVVWSTYDELYLYRGFRTKQLTTDGNSGNAGGDWFPKINDAGDILWLKTNSPNEIHLMAGGTDRRIGYLPDIFSDYDLNNKGQVAYRNFDKTTFLDKGIYLYTNGSSKLITAKPGGPLDLNDNGCLVWQAYDGHDNEIFYYDGIKIKQITDNNVNDYSPEINELNEIVWSRQDGNDTEIYLYKNNKITPLTNNTREDQHPYFADNGEIVWQGFDGNDYEIYHYRANKVNKVTDNNYDDIFPQINRDGLIVWEGFDGTDTEIYRANYNPIQPMPTNPPTPNPVPTYVNLAQNYIKDTYTENIVKLITPEDFGHHFDAGKASIILVHGWNTKAPYSKNKDDLWDWGSNQVKDSDWKSLADDIYARDQANIFLWDWKALSTSALYEGPPLHNVQASAEFLKLSLNDYFADFTFSYKNPVQFIGHSMGGEVSLRTAMAMDQGCYSTFDVAQVTLLDPYNTADLVNGKNYGFFIDHYASMMSKILFPVGGLPAGPRQL